MPLRIYNSLNQAKEEFSPLERGKVRMYVCGVTVYDDCHLGHARAAVVFDVIYRYLKYLGYEVTYIRNFTDIDDKIIKKAQETGEDWKALTQRYIQSYKDVMARLGVEEPSAEPLATNHIDDMLDLIKRLEQNGLAYEAGGDVFYSVRKLSDYGKLSHKKIDELDVGARIGVDERKADPLDFVLWKAAKPGEPQWASPWGEGRPGWHIECSAMSMKYLGDSFDIHGGGRDLIFPHHENEIAQSEGATGKPFARYWIHNGFVNINAEKMSKSLGNIRSIPAILEQWDPEVVRYFLLSANYGSPLDFTDKAMEDAESSLTRFYEMLVRLGDSPSGADAISIDWKQIMENGMNDDFNSPAVIGGVFEAVREINRQLDAGKQFSSDARTEFSQGVQLVHEVLGVFGSDPVDFLARRKKMKSEQAGISEEDVLKLIDERIAARSSKDWKRADEIRDQLDELNVRIKDNPDGTTSWSFESR